jgi:hypothetical protein
MSCGVQVLMKGMIYLHPSLPTYINRPTGSQLRRAYGMMMQTWGVWTMERDLNFVLFSLSPSVTHVLRPSFIYWSPFR